MKTYNSDTPGRKLTSSYIKPYNSDTLYVFLQHRYLVGLETCMELVWNLYGACTELVWQIRTSYICAGGDCREKKTRSCLISTDSE